MALARSLLCYRLGCGCVLLRKLEKGRYASLSFATRCFHDDNECGKVGLFNAS
jgi:hypothetical protein